MILMTRAEDGRRVVPKQAGPLSGVLCFAAHFAEISARCDAWDLQSQCRTCFTFTIDNRLFLAISGCH